MATPPKTPSTTEVTTTKTPRADPQKVAFDMDPELKKQLDSGGSYKPTAEKLEKDYVPPGPGAIGEDGTGGSSGG